MRVARPFPRLLAARLREGLRDTPAILVHGPRQSGRTTLARMVGEPRAYRYISFDDEAAVADARAAPVGVVAALPARSILDEVQRDSETFTSLKAEIDRRQVPGRYILTESANVLFAEPGDPGGSRCRRGAVPSQGAGEGRNDGETRGERGENAGENAGEDARENARENTGGDP